MDRDSTTESVKVHMLCMLWYLYYLVWYYRQRLEVVSEGRLQLMFFTHEHLVSDRFEMKTESKEGVNEEKVDSIRPKKMKEFYQM